MRPLNISGSQAKDYYYGKDAIFGSKDSNSQWHGKLAHDFGLSGDCKEHDFLNVIAGNDPKGIHIIMGGVNKEHRAAIDIPFAAPKSVSVLALHGGKKELIAAHEKAVASTIAYIEKNYLYARKTTNGVTLAHKTGNGLFATFTHSTSRANDPHLHTHTLTMNMTDAGWGYRAIFNDPIFRDQTLLNYVYQSELAKNVMALGYAIENYGQGKWGISGFKDAWVKIFSTRTEQIEHELDRLSEEVDGLEKDDAKTRDMAQKSSRADKDLSLTRDELERGWNEKLDREKMLAGVEAAKAIEHERSHDGLSPGDYIKLAYEAIHESESTFTRQEILKVALELGRGNCLVGDMEKAFSAALVRGDIEHLAGYVNKRGIETNVYADRDMRRSEQSIVHNFEREKDVMEAVADPQHVKEVIEKDFAYFTDGQKTLTEEILTTENRFTIVQGDAGTGKTSALEAVKKIVDGIGGDEKIEIMGFGYTGKAARELEDKAGIKSQTLHSFLNQEPAPVEQGKRQIWIVDESSMVGSRQMEQLVNRAIDQDVQAAWIGDGKQFQALGAGRMFKDLQNQGSVKTVKMEQVLRQKTEYMKQAVGHVKLFQDGKSGSGIDDAFDVLEKNERVHVIENREERIDHAVNVFFDHGDRDKFLILTPVNKDRIEINEVIHNRIKQDGMRELDVNIHSPVSMSGTSRYFAKNYRQGQRAFIESSDIKGLSAGREVVISGVDVENNSIEFSLNDRRHSVDLFKGEVSFSVYERQARKFFEGEKVVFLKNDKALDLSNGQTGTISSIGPQRIITASVDGRKEDVKINLDFYPYVDRGYAITAAKSQAATEIEGMLVTDSLNPLNKTETFYVALSRFENNFTLCTDNVDLVKSQFKQAQPKTSTMDIFAGREKQIDDQSKSISL